MEIVLQVLTLIAIDLLLVAVFVVGLIPLSLFKKATFAILKRNFIGYFSNPTGYAFLFIFVVLTSYYAFWSPEFFSANVATLHQLNLYLPRIMLVFTPAITMSIWADERRTGTDELLLTLPVSHFDVVMGKYLAAVSIFSASLLFSQVAIFAVLNGLALGAADMGLFVATFLGYWFVGVAMLSIGMVASFLTSNLTVAFILGVIFNVPLVFAYNAGWIIPSTNLAQSVSSWSFAAQLEDFGQGVISSPATLYFVMVAVSGIYVCLILVWSQHQGGAFHAFTVLAVGFSSVLFVLFGMAFSDTMGILVWILALLGLFLSIVLSAIVWVVANRRSGYWQFAHYMLRLNAIGIIIAGTSCLLFHFPWRVDVTSQQVNRLSGSSKALIANISDNQPVYIEAYVSGTMPEQFIKAKYDLESNLREIRAISRGNVRVNLHKNMVPFSQEAQQADDRYGIRPTTVATVSNDSFAQEEIFLSAVFTCGLERVVVPFFGQGSSVEYALIRSISTVSGATIDTTADAKGSNGAGAAGRKVIGILRTDAQINGGFDMSTFQQRPPQAIIAQLEQQYDVEDVDPGSEIVDPTKPLSERKYDVLLVVQPSSLTQPQLDGLLAAIRAGQPTAIFEDPLPVQLMGAPGTDQPKPPRGGMMGMGQPPEPKGNINDLWNLLGVKLLRAKQAQLDVDSREDPQQTIDWNPFTAIVWQDYNPYPKVREFPTAVVFANRNVPRDGDHSVKTTFNANLPVVSGLHEVAFLTPGAIQERSNEIKNEEARKLQVTPLVQLGAATSIMASSQPRSGSMILLKEIFSEAEDERESEDVSDQVIDLVAQEGRLETNVPYMLAAHIETRDKEDDRGVNVVLVSDIDLLHSLFLQLREMPSGEVDFRFQNAAFVVNLIDFLAGETTFLDIRSRQTNRASLKLIENRIREDRRRAREAIEEFEDQLNDSRREAASQRQQDIELIEKELQAQQQAGTLDRRQIKDAEQKLQWKRQRNLDDEKAEQERLTRQLAERLRQNEIQLGLDRLKIQGRYKFMALFIPPVPPLLMGLLVWMRRRLREREGVASSRLRS